MENILDIVQCPACRCAIGQDLKCPGCGHQYASIDGVLDLVNQQISRVCGRWSRADLQAGKIENLLEMHRRFFNAGTSQASEVWHRAAAQRAAALSGLTADVGTGLGGMLRELLSAGQPLTAIATDIDPFVLSWIRRKTSRTYPGRELHAVATDARRFAFRDGVLDNVTSADGLINVCGTGEFLCEMLRALRPGGRLLMMHRLFAPDSPSYHLAKVYGIDHTLQRERLLRHMAAAGFRDPSVEIVAEAVWADNPVQQFPVAGDLQQFAIVEARK